MFCFSKYGLNTIYIIFSYVYPYTISAVGILHFCTGITVSHDKHVIINNILRKIANSGFTTDLMEEEETRNVVINKLLKKFKRAVKEEEMDHVNYIRRMSRTN